MLHCQTQPGYTGPLEDGSDVRDGETDQQVHDDDPDEEKKEDKEESEQLERQ